MVDVGGINVTPVGIQANWPNKTGILHNIGDALNPQNGLGLIGRIADECRTYREETPDDGNPLNREQGNGTFGETGTQGGSVDVRSEGVPDVPERGTHS